MTREVERTADGRYVVVDGRRWRTASAAGDDAAVAAARARGQLAKTGWGSGTPWWRKDLPAPPHRSQARVGPLHGGRS